VCIVKQHYIQEVKNTLVNPVHHVTTYHICPLVTYTAQQQMVHLCTLNIMQARSVFVGYEVDYLLTLRLSRSLRNVEFRLYGLATRYAAKSLKTKFGI